MADRALALGLEVLGFDLRVLDAVRYAPSAQVAEDNLKKIQFHASRAFRKAALRLHPDVTGGDRQKEEKFKAAKSALDWICSRRVRKTRRPRTEGCLTLNVVVRVVDAREGK